MPWIWWNSYACAPLCCAPSLYSTILGSSLLLVLSWLLSQGTSASASFHSQKTNPFWLLSDDQCLKACLLYCWGFLMICPRLSSSWTHVVCRLVLLSLWEHCPFVLSQEDVSSLPHYLFGLSWVVLISTSAFLMSTWDSFLAWPCFPDEVFWGLLSRWTGCT